MRGDVVKRSVVNPTLKGEALLEAVKAGLVKKKVTGEVELDSFNRFWENLVPLLCKYGYRRNGRGDK